MIKIFQVYTSNYPYASSCNIRFKSWNLWLKSPIITHFWIDRHSLKFTMEIQKPIDFFIDENWDSDVPF
jgi:hypothetical protein